MNLVKYFLVALLLITGACQSSNPVTDGGTADVSISFNLPDPDARWELPKSLGKALAVDRIILRVNGPGMDEIVQNLTLNPARNRASGTLEVPKGKDRIFIVIVKDENNITQYVGTKTVSIQSNSATVDILTEGIYPNPVTLSIPRVGVWSVDLGWTRNGDDDFDSYDVVRSNTLDLSPGNRDLLRSIVNPNNTDFIDLTTDGNTEYYYAVIVWDTEGMGMRSDPVGLRTGQFAELAYDDDDPFSWYSWPQVDQGSANLLTAPFRVKVVTARYYIVDVTLGGAFRALVFTLDATSTPVIHGQRDVTATSTGWFDVDFSADNIYVNDEFYVMIQYDGVDQPRFGYDPDDNSRAWDYDPYIDPPYWRPWTETYFMRAIVLQEGGLLKELAPTPPGDANPALSGPKGPLPNARATYSVTNSTKAKSSGRD